MSLFIHARRAPSVNDDAWLDAGAALRAAKVGGVPLAREEQEIFEPRFGRDFGRVHVHADGAADDGARAVRAQARAHRRQRHRLRSPASMRQGDHEGRRLMAHGAPLTSAGGSRRGLRAAPTGAGRRQRRQRGQMPTITVFVADPQEPGRALRDPDRPHRRRPDSQGPQALHRRPPGRLQRQAAFFEAGARAASSGESGRC